MQHRDHQGEGQQGGHQGANSAGNKNQLAGNPGNQRPDGTFERENSGRNQTSQSMTNYDSNVNRYSDLNRSTLSKKFSQKHGLNQQQSDYAADSFLGSVNWASQQKRDDDFRDFVNPQTSTKTNPLYSNWQKEYDTRLRQTGFEDNQATKLSSEEPDEYIRELSSNGTDENWYRNYGNDGRDVSDNGSDGRSRAERTGNDDSDNRREGESHAQADFRDGQTRVDGLNMRDGRQPNHNHPNDARSITSEENSDSSDAEAAASLRRTKDAGHLTH